MSTQDGQAFHGRAEELEGGTGEGVEVERWGSVFHVFVRFQVRRIPLNTSFMFFPKQVYL